MAKRFHIILDGLGYMIDKNSYRVTPSPLFGSKFSSGRYSYSSLDFWQVGAMTDFSHGSGQKYLVDPSSFSFSLGIDASKQGEIRLEKDLKTRSLPTGVGEVCSSYATLTELYIGTTAGKIFKSADGVTFTLETLPVTSGKIYSFFELGGNLYACKGAGKMLKNSSGTWTETAVTGIFWASVQEESAIGLFGGTTKVSTDGATWTKTWQIALSEGDAVGFASIPHNYFIGTQKSLWVHLGGGSGIRIFTFPSKISADNFRGMHAWSTMVLFSIENYGVFFSEGTSIYPTNLNNLNEFFPFTSCRGINSVGNDIYALVKDSSNWYLARACLNYLSNPSYFWLAKKITGKTPCHLASFKNTLLVFYTDGTADYLDSSSYQSEGYLISSRVDQNLILLQKLYHSILGVSEPLKANSSLDLRYEKDDEKSFSEFSTWSSKTFSTTGATNFEYSLSNPTLGKSLRIGAKLKSSSASESPVVTDLGWKYILEEPEERYKTKQFSFSVIAQDKLEKLDSEVWEKDEVVEGRSRIEILDDLWASSKKKQLLNFVGMDNVETQALKVTHTGSSCKLTVDKSNNKITASTGETFSYLGLTLGELNTLINAEAGFSSEIPALSNSTTSAEDLMPISTEECKNGLLLYTGTDVHTVLFTSTTPRQFKITLADPGADRLLVNLREV